VPPNQHGGEPFVEPDLEMPMLRHLVLAALILLGIAARAQAADIKVTYLVDATQLKAKTPAGTPLTFKLFPDSACVTTAVATQTTNVENVK
jgi:hypothetical protein